LREKVGIAGSGDTIDLSQLPTLCGVADSTITLSSGEIMVAQNDLTLLGPDPSAGSVAIAVAANSQSRAFDHSGNGTFILNALTVQNGKLSTGANNAVGGCIKSSGNVILEHSTVKSCNASGAGAFGGGIMTSGSLVLLDSTVSGSMAVGNTSPGLGGGVYASGGLTVKYSTLTANIATTYGGGAYVHNGGYALIDHSTVEGNMAAHCGGGAFYNDSGVTIADSTISGNSATETGGVCIRTSAAEISNSTIASNAEFAAVSHGSGIKIYAWDSLTLQSSIVANNVTGLGYMDLYVVPFPGLTISGTDNLVVAADATLPAGVITLTSDPKLGPLQLNGGSTRTHALLPGSPAIGQGNNAAGSVTDQRGPGYSRTTGVSTDIGAIQFDAIFVGRFD
jgi:hypothetical protein